MNCFDCERALEDGEEERLDDDEVRCYICAEMERFLAKIEAQDRWLDDPRYGQGTA